MADNFDAAFNEAFDSAPQQEAPKPESTDPFDDAFHAAFNEAAPVEAKAQEGKEDVAKVWDATKALAGEAWDWTKEKLTPNLRLFPETPAYEGLNTKTQLILEKVGHELMDTGGAGVKASIRVLDTLDRGLGSAIGVPALWAADHLAGTHYLKDAFEKNPGMLPISFQRDFFQDPAENLTRKLGKELQKYDSTAYLGGLVEGVAPAVGIAAGILGPVKFNPLGGVKLGALTEAGLEAEKVGELTGGVLKQIARGERNALSYQIPFTEKQLVAPVNALTVKALAPVQNAMVAGEMTKLGQFGRKFTTFSGLRAADEAAPAFVVEKNMAESAARQKGTAIFRKAQAIGVDLNNAEVRQDLYRFAQNPSSYKGAVPPEKADAVFNLLEGMRSEWSDAAEKAGIVIPEFKSRYAQRAAELEEELATKAKTLAPQGYMKARVEASQELQAIKANPMYAERYVPTGSTPSARQEAAAKKILGDQATAEEIADTFEGSMRGSGKGGVGAYTKQKTKLNREQMNALLKEKTGMTQDFFHDDLVAAYMEKYADVMTDVARKKFITQVYQGAAKSDADWVAIIKGAKDQVATGSLDPMVQRLARMNLSDIKELSEPARNRLSSLGRISEDIPDAAKLKLPGPARDLVESLISPQTAKDVEGMFQRYMRAWKNNALFSAGVHLRNTAENVARSMAVGNDVSDLMSASGAVIFGKNPYLSKVGMSTQELLEEMKSMTKGHNLTSYERAIGENPYLLTTRKLGQETAYENYLAKANLKDNANQRLQWMFKNLGMNGKLSHAIEKLKTTVNPFDTRPGFLSDNPLYRGSAEVGENMERVHRFAYYKKLREQGYLPTPAWNKVQNAFMNYDLTRGSVRSAQKFIPFLNYQVKNAETTLRLLAMNPNAALTFAPGGSLQRAIENWNNWSPEDAIRMREAMGEYHTDDVLGTFLGHADAVEQKKDFLRDFANKWLNRDGERDGYLTWARLPSNYHALLNMNPVQVDLLSGPLAKIGVTLLGLDPFTGQPMRYKGTDQGWLDSTLAALKVASEPAQFRQTLVATQALKDKFWPEYEKNLDNLGLSPGVVSTFTNAKLDKKSKEQLAKLMTAGLGGATRVDLDIAFRMMAMLGRSRDELQLATNDLKRDPTANKGRMARWAENYKRTLSDIKKMREAREDYEDRRIRLGGAPDAIWIPEDKENEDSFEPPTTLLETPEEYRTELVKKSLDIESNNAQREIDSQVNSMPGFEGLARDPQSTAPATLEEYPDIGRAKPHEIPVFRKLNDKNGELYRSLEDYYKSRKPRFFADNKETGERGWHVVDFHPMFMAKADNISRKIGVRLADLLGVMAFETGGTFNPKIMNQSGSGATGLIQFMGDTARSLGYSRVQDISQMDQLDLVEKYLSKTLRGVSRPDLSDLYMAVLNPAAVGKGPGAVLFKEGTRAYSQNRGLDLNRDGKITKQEASRQVREWRP